MTAWDDRLNPVLVKEVRQSLRGRLFRVLFVINLSVAAVAAIIALQTVGVDQDFRSPGRTVFAVLHGVYAGCAFLLLPLMANRGMAGERDQETFDALLVSGLPTRKIVLGKWLASGVMLVLFLSASAPFLSLGFALFGLDLVTSVVLLALSTFAGFGLCLVGILTATLVRNRAMDVLMLGLQLLATGLAFSIWLAFSSYWVFGEMFRSSDVTEFLVVTGVCVVCAMALLRWLYCVTVARLSHPEENASTGVRAASVTLTAVLAASGLVLFSYSLPSTLATEQLQTWIAVTIVTATLALFGVATEPDGLGRRTREEVRGGRWRRPGIWVFAPGGARGLALLLAVLGPLLLLAAAPVVFEVPSRRTHGLGLLTLSSLIVTTVGAASLLAGRPDCTPRARTVVRAAALGAPYVLVVLAMVLGLLTGDRDLIQGQHALNPIWTIARAFDGESGVPSAVVAYVGAALLVLLANMRRMVTARGEVVARRPTSAQLEAAADARKADARAVEVRPTDDANGETTDDGDVPRA